MGFPDGAVVKNQPTNAGDTEDTVSVSGLGRSPGGGNGNPLQYSCLENPWVEEPGGLQSMGLQTAEHNWVTEHNNSYQNIFLNCWQNTNVLASKSYCK